MSDSTTMKNELRAAARAAASQLGGGKVAARSLKRIAGYTGAEVVKLAEQGDGIREDMLRRSGNAWVRKK